MDSDKIIKGESFGEITVKKSKFIASVCYVDSEQRAEEYIKSKKKQYYDARHNCSCYIIGKGGIEKSSDDGEPSGTAGRPMLEIIKGHNIYNVVCVVTRYFGGILLGTGGLVRAYQDAVRQALQAAEFCYTYTAQVIEVKSDYNNWPKIEKLCRSDNYTIAKVDYLENVKALIEIPVDETQYVIEKITDTTNAKALVSKKEITEAKRSAS